ncbi:uncharacterized protein LOC123705299 [Colias croceus]|uniref:uncharacterized protein LOC123705299 n=1 Tax=Colias crocea TaxID=72248 RepID=UPI001E27F38B|nr:uncharacterized protein LOC123705299 [Colias croceus]
MPLRKVVKGTPLDLLPEGLLHHDEDALTPCQKECTARLGVTMQLEQEAYLSQHPEIRALLEIFVGKISRTNKRKGILKEAAEHFTRPVEQLDAEIRNHLGLPQTDQYVKEGSNTFVYKDTSLINDLIGIINTNFPPEPIRIPTPEVSSVNTASSSFISIMTSDTTLPTPEPIPTPEPTLSEHLFGLVSNTVDKAIFLHVDDGALRYDTAYVELTKAVEEAMEIPVVEIKEDIAELYFNAYKMFEMDIMEKERIAAEIAWEKRMRKKMKRTLRRLDNFKGYATPPTPKSEISSHESYKKPPPKPCVCHPQIHYNRYPKDRFGIYLPRETEFSEGNVTVTPAISLESVAGEPAEENVDTKSVMSKRSATSAKSAVSKKTTFKE